MIGNRFFNFITSYLSTINDRSFFRKPLMRLYRTIYDFFVAIVIWLLVKTFGALISISKPYEKAVTTQ